MTRTNNASETPILDLIEAMTSASIEYTNLSADELLKARVAALAAVGAGPLSYLAHLGPAAEVGFTLRDVQQVLVAIAPIVGTARLTMAAESLAEAFGFAFAILDGGDQR